MPTNLPPQYFEVEARFREAQAPEEKIARLEEMISIVPKHKGTEKLVGDLRRRLSKLKDAAQTRKKVSRRESAFHIVREGAGQAMVVGTANVGKSALVTALTNATPEVGEAPFTTWAPTPGMMPVKGIQIQLVDTPPLNQEYIEPELLELIRRTDLLLLLVGLQTYPLQHFEQALDILALHRIVPYPGQDPPPLEGRQTAVPTLVVVNEVDDEGLVEDVEIFREILGGDWETVPVSAATGYNLETLKKIVFDRLGIIRVFARPPGEEPDLSAPFAMKRGSTVGEFARQVHQDFYKKLKSARVWGSGVFDGQMVGRDHVLHDGDVVELRI